MSAKAIWAAAPAIIRQAPTPKPDASAVVTATLVATNNKPPSPVPNKKFTMPLQPGVVPAGTRCKHGLEQPRVYHGTGQAGEAISSMKTTCYRCTFCCFRCGNDVTGICEDCF